MPFKTQFVIRAGFEPAKTWDELAEQSKAIYDEKGISGYTGA